MTDGVAGGRPDERLTLGSERDADGFRPVLSAVPGRFADSFGGILVRVEGEAVRCRVDTGRPQSNISDHVHGGFILSYVDQAMFCAVMALDRLPPGGAVTLQAGMRFIGAAAIGVPLDAVIDIVGETGRMLFLRGTIEQAGATIGSFDGTLRKVRGAGAA